MCAIWSFLLGIVGWFAVGFFGKPLLDFLNLRSQVHEEIIFTCDKAQESLRRLGAKVHATNDVTTWLPLPWHATNVIASLPLRWYLSKTGYDLVKAGGGLIGLSNSMGDDPSDYPRAASTKTQVRSMARETRNYYFMALAISSSTFWICTASDVSKRSRGSSLSKSGSKTPIIRPLPRFLGIPMAWPSS